MINPIDYYYYKIYKAMSYITMSDEPEVYLLPVLALAPLCNVLSISKVIIGEFSGLLLILFLILSALFYIIFYNPRRADKIINKYKNETEKSRTWGNIIVAIYWVGSFLIVYFVFRPQ